MVTCIFAIHTSDSMLETRPIQVIKRMFLQENLYQASFPQVKFQMPAPYANKQFSCTSNSMFICNGKQFGAYPAALLDNNQLSHTCPSVTWLISETAFVILENFRKQWF